ncbi:MULTISPECIES: late competence development ComFB family protein [unclassified Sedimentibacter]|uniref:late competence development ComFB family protein n=1 Tax=unclassified Sedimentibacter TaxID=2649220 RepID=UPI0027E0C509|nr:late competence development ComFB family protein [Sedimentibacter sp. MB35-C1]WMJ78622.1 late competence development ComFB family protein [Sedimentibacter sp. MB35-C1]
MVINYTEEIVKNCLTGLLKNDPAYKEICKCEQCIDDITAKALNNLKPNYITTKKGEVYAEYSSLEFQHQAEVIAEVIKAIEFISKHPSH